MYQYKLMIIYIYFNIYLINMLIVDKKMQNSVYIHKFICGYVYDIYHTFTYIYSLVLATHRP